MGQKSKTMSVKMLVIQRRESYLGEFAPEVLAAVDDWTDSDNPEWFARQVREQLGAFDGTGELEASAVVTAELPLAPVMAVLRPATTVAASVVQVDDPGRQA